VNWHATKITGIRMTARRDARTTGALRVLSEETRNRAEQNRKTSFWTGRGGKSKQIKHSP
jgi:hypothetical protein